MTKKIAIGFDHGNGYIKGKSDLVERYIIPSALAYERNVPTALTERLGNKKKDLRKGASNLDADTTYVWGNDVFEIKDYYLTMGHQDRIKNSQYKILSEVALAELAGEEETIDAVIVSGVPSGDLNTQTEHDLKDFLGKSHVSVVENKNVVVKVSHVVILPQPVGTVMYKYLDKDGFVQNDEYETDKVAIVDIGKGTTDVDIIDSLQRQDEYFSIDKGMYDVYSRIAREINKNPGAKSKAKPEMVEKYFENASYVFSNRHIVPFEKEKEEAIKNVGEELVTEITQKWKTWDRFDKIILTGGGAKVFAKYFRAIISDIEVIEDSQFANAEGFYRYAKYIAEVKYGAESVPAEV